MISHVRLQGHQQVFVKRRTEEPNQTNPIRWFVMGLKTEQLVNLLNPKSTHSWFYWCSGSFNLTKLNLEHDFYVNFYERVQKICTVTSLFLLAFFIFDIYSSFPYYTTNNRLRMQFLAVLNLTLKFFACIHINDSCKMKSKLIKCVNRKTVERN